MRTILALALVLVLALAGCTHAPTAIVALGGGGGSGSVVNAPTTFPAFSSSATTALNDGSGEAVFNMTFQDDNSEDDMVKLTIFANGTGGFTSTHAVSKEQRNATSEPANFGPDHWKVWSGTLSDGILYASYDDIIAKGATQAVLTVSVSVTDAESIVNYIPSSQDVTLTVRAPSAITVASAPVDWTGVAQTGISWGAWSASPGDGNVASANYLKLTNTGGYATPTVVVDFTENVFTGTSDSTSTVPLDANVQFAYWEDTTPASTSPSQGNYTWDSTAPGGAVTLTFAATNDIIYVAYRIVALPTPLVAQSYSATYTVTDITT